MAKTYAIVEGGMVANTALADEPLADNWVLATAGVGIGWLYDGATFSRPPTPEPQPDPVPHSCTRRQGRLALLAQGLLDDVEAAIAAIADPLDQRAAQIEYEADTWERDNPFVQQTWTQLDGTPEQLDELFRMAATL
ncbi:hypothetical protein [Comamonas sp.]|uniref:hypothetical protein n=1 Tax=Comamonas sp. TaxID=34028 RepID=UPI002FCA3FA6